MRGTLHLPLDPLCLPFSANAAYCRICAHVGSGCEGDMMPRRILGGGGLNVGREYGIICGVGSNKEKERKFKWQQNVDIVIRARMVRDVCIRRRGSMSIVMMKNIASGAGLQVMVRGVCILRRRSIGMGQARTSAFGVVRRRRVRGACIHRRGVTRNNPRQILF